MTARTEHREEEGGNGRALPPIYFLATYWGEKFQDWLCCFAFASLLSPNNIPALTNRSDCRFLICTTAADWERLQADPWFQLLREKIQIIFLPNEERFPGEHKYVRMSRGHAMLADACFRDGTFAFNVNPDSIYPDGCVAEVQRLARNGHRIVLCAAIRFEMEGVERELSERGHFKAGKPLDLSMRESVEIGLRNLHPESKASCWCAANFGALSPEHRRDHYLTCCYWEAPDKRGVIILTHNWAPLLVDYTMLTEHDTRTLDGRAIDGVYIFENFRDARVGPDIHVVSDSDSIFLLGMTPSDEMEPPSDGYWWKTAPIAGYWSKGYILNQTIFDPAVDQTRRRLYRIPVYWHVTSLSSSWRKTESLAMGVIRRFARKDLNVLNACRSPNPLKTAAMTLTSLEGVAVTAARILLSPLFVTRRLSGRMLGNTGVYYVLEFLRRLPLYRKAVWQALRGDADARARIRARLDRILKAGRFVRR